MSLKSFPGGVALHVFSAQARLSAMRKTVYNAGVGLDEHLGSGFVPWFITLTYRTVDQWRPDHIKDYLKRIRSWLYRKGLKLHYVWVAELQKRGAVHYHLLVWFPKGLWIPMSDRRGWWPHGFTESKPARKRVGYLMKYASKGVDSVHKFPKKCRTYAVGGLTQVIRQRVRFWRAPKWFRSQLPDGSTHLNCDIRRISGGCIEKLSGFQAFSPWRYLTWTKTGVMLYKVDDLDAFDFSALVSLVPSMSLEFSHV